jgi:hypothetical protein
MPIKNVYLLWRKKFTNLNSASFIRVCLLDSITKIKYDKKGEKATVIVTFYSLRGEI